MVQLANQVLDASSRLDVDLPRGNCEQRNTATKPAENLVTYHIHLVKDDNIRKLNLIHHEIRHSPLILQLDIITTGREHVVRLKIVVDREGVNHRDRGIQAGKLLQPTSCLPITEVSTCLSKDSTQNGEAPDYSQSPQNPHHILIQTPLPTRQGIHLLGQALVKGLGNLLGLADAAALDDNVVELLELGEAQQLLKEVAAERAADAAVLQGDDLFLRLSQTVGLLDQGGVDVDSSPVVCVLDNLGSVSSTRLLTTAGGGRGPGGVGGGGGRGYVRSNVI